MSERHDILRHVLAVIAYRTQKGLRGAPPDFGGFEAGEGVRTPRELIHHMGALMGYTLAALEGAQPTKTPPLAGLEEEVERFHLRLEELSDAIAAAPLEGRLANRLVQGPLGDALTHAGQLSLLRRLAGAPVSPENFFEAEVDASNLGRDQPVP